jgi:hypothetical protein
VTKVGEVLERLEKGEEEILAVRNFGRKSLEELREKLVSKGFLSPMAEAALPTSTPAQLAAEGPDNGADQEDMSPDADLEGDDWEDDLDGDTDEIEDLEDLTEEPTE